MEYRAKLAAQEDADAAEEVPKRERQALAEARVQAEDRVRRIEERAAERTQQMDERSARKVAVENLASERLRRNILRNEGLSAAEAAELLEITEEKIEAADWSKRADARPEAAAAAVRKPIYSLDLDDPIRRNA